MGKYCIAGCVVGCYFSQCLNFDLMYFLELMSCNQKDQTALFQSKLLAHEACYCGDSCENLACIHTVQHPRVFRHKNL